MDNNIFSEFLNLLQNSSDGKTLVAQSNVPPADIQKVAQAVLPKITEQVKSSPQTLGDLFAIFTQNKDDPDSLLNSQPGFDKQQAHNEGAEILKTLFGGSGQTNQVAEEVSQKTGVSIVDISSMMPMLAAMATKILGNKANAVTQGNSSELQDSEAHGRSLNEILGFLDINKDGSISDDLGRMGQQILGNLFKEDKNKEV